MRKFNYLLLIFLFALSTRAFSQQTIEIFEPQKFGLREDCAKKIDPIFLAMFGKSTDYIEKSKSITPIEKNYRGEIVLSAIIKTNNINELKTIESVVVGSVHGNIVTATFEFNKLADIANLERTIYIEASIFLHYNLDESVPDTKADSVWSPQGGYVSTIKGDSVLIGIMDSGIDWNHRDFISNDELYSSNPENWQTRIMYIWDQHISNDPHYPVSSPDGYTYGLEYSSTEINQAIQGGDTLTTNDTSGHGTHVAGIAAGDGTSTDSTYIGMAPESRLIVCKNNGESLWAFGDGTTVGSLDGFDWMLDKADELNLPLIVNQSQGLDTGPHDGSTLYEQAINNDIQNNGLRLVISAGNSRTDDKHASHSIPSNGEHEFIIDVQPNYLEDGTAKHIQFWYSENNSFSISVKNEHVTTWSNPLSLGTTTQTISFGILGYYGSCEVSNLSSPLNNDNLINIIITGLGGIPIVDPNAGAGEWEFKIIDDDTYANEIINGYIERNINLKFTNCIDENGTISMPGSASDVITVASYNTKNEWISNNSYPSFTGYFDLWDLNITIGDISWFSSKGPLRNEINLSKPDITAPGAGIGSSYSSHANWGNDWILDENPSNQHAITHGTSMSAPHVTGACALLLQKFPYLTCSDLKTILKENANTSYPSGDEKDWGAGKLDILSAYKYMVGYYAQGYIPSFQTAYNNHPYLEGLPIESVDDYWDLTLKQRLTNGMILKPSQSVSAYWLGEEIFTTWDSLGNVSSPLGVPDTTEYIDATNNNYRTVDFENGTIYWNGNETIYKYLDANFYADRTEGLNPITVIFSDSSTAVNTTITSWYWDFGDNEYSTAQDPTHLYNGEGVFTVSLTVSDGRNSNTETKNNYINVLDPNTSGFIEGMASLIGGNGNIEDIEISAGGLTVNPNPTGYYAIGLTSGLYDVTASLNNYQSVTNHNVEVTAGQYTENIIFILISSDIAISVIQDGSGDYTTIQAAIDAAVNGNVISVHPGTYTENINYNGKNITVGSLFFTTHNSSYISQTIIDGNQNGTTVVTFENGENSSTVLCGFTIRNGSHGIVCVSSSPSIENVTITGNSAPSGGGIYCSSSSPSLENVTISNNSASIYGGGIYCGNSNSSLVDVTITNNSASYGGGGIYCYRSILNLENVTISNNLASFYGGGIYCDYDSSPSLTNVTITGNSATGTYGNGGGIYCHYYSNPSFSAENRCNIYSNNVQSRGSGADIYWIPNFPIKSYSKIAVIVDTFTVMTPTDYYASPIDNFTFDILHSVQGQVETDLYVSPSGDNNNDGLTAQTPLKTIQHATSIILADSENPHTIHLADGIYSPSTNGEFFPVDVINYVSLVGESEDGVVLDAESVAGVMQCFNVHSSTISNLTLTNGSSRLLMGGGIACWDSGPSLENVTITGNSASRGGGIWCSSYSSPSLENVTISNNLASDNGGGIYCYYYSSPSLVDVTITGNSANYGGGIFCSYNSSPSLYNTIVSDNIGNYGIYVYSGNPTITYSDFYNNETGNFYGLNDSIGVNVTTNANGDSCDVFYNIQMDPLFLDAVNGDYHLSWSNYPVQDSTMSPCIDSGDPDSPLDPDGTIADMGAYYFNQGLYVEPTELDFQNVFIGNDSTLSVTLKNYSDSVITIYNVLCSDTVFTTNWSEPTIPAGDSLVIDVTFTPNTTGIKIGILTIENSYIDKNVSLSGNGLGAYILPDLYALNFGAIEPGYPDTLLLEISNDGNINLTIQNIIDAPTNYFNFISITDSTILPDNSIILHIEFDPQVEGLFSDSLFIVSNAYNEDTLAINLSGEGGLTPAPVENLTINVDSVNASLNWDEVTTTIHGNPLVVDCYIIYYGSSPDTVFGFLGINTETNYTHEHVAFFSNNMFYKVTAYVGDLDLLLNVIQKHPNIKLGELDRLIEKQKLRINRNLRFIQRK